MPIENRSSNTEMVSVPREPTEAMKNAADGLEFTFASGDEDWTGLISADMADEIYRLMIEAASPPQPHPAPIAWMVDTAFWWTKEEAERDAAETGLPIVGLGPMSGVAPAEQHQGEPLGWVRPQALEALKDVGWVHVFAAKGGDDSAVAVYTHADPAEVERLRGEVRRLHEAGEFLDNVSQGIEDKLRAQLAEAQALLRDALASHGTLLMTDPPQDPWKTRRISARIGAHLSASAEPKCGRCHGRRLLRIATVCGPADKVCPDCASAEPSAPTPMPSYMEAACDKFDWTPEEALRFYAEGKHFDTDNGRTRILCTGAIASHALKGMSKEYADLKGSEQGEPSAPVEIDERAELEAYCTKVGLPLDRLPSGEYMIPATRFVSQGWHAHAASSRKQ